MAEKRNALNELYEKVSNLILGSKGMSVDDVHKKVKSKGSLPDQEKYVKEMMRNIEEQHPEYLNKNTKRSLEIVDSIINYEKNTGDEIKEGISPEKMKEISEYYKNLGDKAVKDMEDQEKDIDERIKSGVHEHSESYESMHLMHVRPEIKKDNRFEAAKNYAKSFRLDGDNEEAKKNAMELLTGEKAFIPGILNISNTKFRMSPVSDIPRRYEKVARILIDSLDLEKEKKNKLIDTTAKLYERLGDNEWTDYSSNKRYRKALEYKPDDEELYRKALNSGLGQLMEYKKGIEENYRPVEHVNVNDIKEIKKFFDDFSKTYAKRGDLKKYKKLRDKSKGIAQEVLKLANPYNKE